MRELQINNKTRMSYYIKNFLELSAMITLARKRLVAKTRCIQEI